MHKHKLAQSTNFRRQHASFVAAIRYIEKEHDCILGTYVVFLKSYQVVPSNEYDNINTFWNTKPPFPLYSFL